MEFTYPSQHQAFHGCAAVKELSLSYHNDKNVSHIYESILIMATSCKFLRGNQDEGASGADGSLDPLRGVPRQPSFWPSRS